MFMFIGHSAEHKLCFMACTEYKSEAVVNDFEILEFSKTQ